MRTDGRTDRHDGAKGRFSQFCGCIYKRGDSLQAVNEENIDK